MANPISKLNLLINGVTTQLDVHDANALTTEIDSMGEGWVRFKCGLQICWGTRAIAWELQERSAVISFAKSFKGIPSISLTHRRNGFTANSFSEIYGISESNFSVTWIATSATANLDGTLSWSAIGKWK